MNWLSLEVLERRGMQGNYVLLGVVFVCFWIQWMLNDIWFDRLTLTGLRLPGLLTHSLLHVHSLHLLWNLFLLHVLGAVVCNELGAARHILLFAVFSMTAGMAHAWLDGDQAVGASGAVCGYAGLALSLRLEGAVTFLDDAIRLRVRTLAWLLLAKDVLFMVLPDLQVSAAGHFGGYIVGAVTGLLMRRISLLRGAVIR